MESGPPLRRPLRFYHPNSACNGKLIDLELSAVGGEELGIDAKCSVCGKFIQLECTLSEIAQLVFNIHPQKDRRPRQLCAATTSAAQQDAQKIELQLDADDKKFLTALKICGEE
jgi:hypothetical protein